MGKQHVHVIGKDNVDMFNNEEKNMWATIQSQEGMVLKKHRNSSFYPWQYVKLQNYKKIK